MNFNLDNILLDTNFDDNQQLFKAIATVAFSQKAIKSAEGVIESFNQREKQGTTGFEDSFAIPHARSSFVIEPTVFVVRNSNKFKGWESLDGNGVKYAICLLIPEGANDTHMEVLSHIATNLINEDFRNVIKVGTKNDIFQNFQKMFAELNSKSNEEITASSFGKGKKLIVGISACPAGIAHTFMAKQKMEDAAKEAGFDIRWETQGSRGPKDVLTSDEIAKAEVVIIASDIELDLTRFHGKRVWITNTNDAIKNGIKLLNEALAEAKIMTNPKTHNSGSFIKVFFASYKKSFQGSFNFPWIYLSITATLLSIISLIAISIYGRSWVDQGIIKNENLYKIQAISQFALYLSMPLMAGNIAQKMTGHSHAFALAFISALLLNAPSIMVGFNSITGYNQQNIPILFDWNGTFESSTISHGSNIVGALFGTFITVMAVNVFSKITTAMNKFKIVSWGLSPWFSVTLLAALILFGGVFLFGAPMAYVSSKITWLFITYGNEHWWIRFIVGGVLTSLIAFDLGGFVNKSALIFFIGFAQYDLRFASLIAIGIPLSSIGLGTTYFFRKKRFSQVDAISASLSFRKGLNGMTEGPLELTNKYGLKLKIPNLISTFIAGGLALVLNIYILKGGHIGILYIGAQAHLAQANDIWFLNELLPVGKGAATFFSSIAYGIIAYYFVMLVGAFSYMGIAAITFNIGKNKVWAPRNINIKGKHA